MYGERCHCCGAITTACCLFSWSLGDASVYRCSPEDTRLQLKKLPVIPTSCLQEHPSIAFWWVEFYLRLTYSTTLACLCWYADSARKHSLVNSFMQLGDNFFYYFIHFFKRCLFILQNRNHKFRVLFKHLVIFSFKVLDKKSAK